MIHKKIRKRDVIAVLCKRLKKNGKKIGFTSGAFDILHSGHASYLEKAKKKCDVLVVGINSDASVKKYKGANRPIIPENERIALIAALASVDYCFLFDERRNAINIESLKPNYYIKAADYSEETLTSKEVVEQHGGKVVLIPLKEGLSTSSIIEKVITAFSPKKRKVVEREHAAYLNIRPTKVSQAVFVDRDGTINQNIGFLHEPKKFRLLPNTIEGLTLFQNMRLKIVIVTDQAGIGLGYFTKEDFFAVNMEMLKQFSENDIIIDKIYFCPHARTENCNCKKPRIGLVQQAQVDLNLDLKHSYFIGDSTKDIEAGKRAGCTTILVKTGHKGEDAQYKSKPNYVARDLKDAAMWIRKRQRK